MKPGETYACPKCGAPMRKHDGPYMIWHCLPCQISYDTFRPTDPPPRIVEAQVEPVDPYADVRAPLSRVLAGDEIDRDDVCAKAWSTAERDRVEVEARGLPEHVDYEALILAEDED